MKKSLGCQRDWSHSILLVSGFPSGHIFCGRLPLTLGLWTPWEQKPVFPISPLPDGSLVCFPGAWQNRGAINICWLRSVYSELDKRQWLTRGCIRCHVSELPPGPALRHPISNHTHGKSLSSRHIPRSPAWLLVFKAGTKSALNDCSLNKLT